jgi:glycosyltransferase involved in cell wall biosynthesis
MRILFLTQVLPYPLDAGPKVRAYYVLRYLAQRHDVTLVSFVRATDTPEAVTHLEKFCCGIYTTPMPRGRLRDASHLARSLLMDTPFLIARDEVRTMRDLLVNVVRNAGPFDAIHADQLWMAPYAEYAQSVGAGGRRPPVTLDQHNAVYLIPERMQQDAANPLKRRLLDLEARKLAAYEVDACSRFDHVVWVTQEDYQAVYGQANGAGSRLRNSGVIPICTEVDAQARVTRTKDPRRVTFLGGLHYPPNAEGVLWFAREVFPAILAQAPDAVLTVIGKQPPVALQQLPIPERNLDVTGYVVEPRPYLEQTAAFIVPLHAGGGMRVKILDAWRWGLPIVSTGIGAEGIQVTSGEDMLIADTSGDFAAATVALLRDAGAGRRLADAGFSTLSRRYDWQRVYPQWDQIYAQ